MSHIFGTPIKGSVSYHIRVGWTQNISIVEQLVVYLLGHKRIKSCSPHLNPINLLTSRVYRLLKSESISFALDSMTTLFTHADLADLKYPRPKTSGYMMDFFFFFLPGTLGVGYVCEKKKNELRLVWGQVVFGGLWSCVAVSIQ